MTTIKCTSFSHSGCQCGNQESVLSRSSMFKLNESYSTEVSPINSNVLYVLDGLNRVRVVTLDSMRFCIGHCCSGFKGDWRDTAIYANFQLDETQ